MGRDKLKKSMSRSAQVSGGSLKAMQLGKTAKAMKAKKARYRTVEPPLFVNIRKMSGDWGRVPLHSLEMPVYIFRDNIWWLIRPQFRSLDYSQLRLIHKSTLLEDDKTLSYYGVQGGDDVTLVLLPTWILNRVE